MLTILEQNIRVGDEKAPSEADTVGAITLRPEHFKIEGSTLHFDFLGKDSVRWVSQVKASPSVTRNIEMLQNVQRVPLRGNRLQESVKVSVTENARIDCQSFQNVENHENRP